MEWINVVMQWAWVPVVLWVAYELVMWPVRIRRERHRRRAREAARIARAMASEKPRLRGI